MGRKRWLRLLQEPEDGGDAARVVAATADDTGLAVDLVAHGVLAAAGAALPVGMHAVGGARGLGHRLREERAVHGAQDRRCVVY